MQSPFVLTAQIPAKALLFGEFGVLQEFPAIAATFWDHHFSIKIEFSRSYENKNSVVVKSSFFKTGSENADPFFIHLLKPWEEFLGNKKISIEIQNSFPPSLGFGSSSALIAGVSQILWQFLFPEKTDFLTDDFFWSQIRKSIECIQVSGSGYDVAVQLAAGQISDKPFSIWKFLSSRGAVVSSRDAVVSSRGLTAGSSLNHTPHITPQSIPKETWAQYGCFVKTHIYSDTKRSIQKFNQSHNKETFSRNHGELALEFLKDHSVEHVQYLLHKSKEIALLQGILPLEISRFKKLVRSLEENEIAYKTMGSGDGDCLWVLANRKKLIEKCWIPSHDIAFAFEDCL